MATTQRFLGQIPCIGTFFVELEQVFVERKEIHLETNFLERKREIYGHVGWLWLRGVRCPVWRIC